MSFLALDNLHVFITGAAGGIGSEAVREFLAQGCKVTAHDRLPITNTAPSANIFIVTGDISSEDSIGNCIASAKAHFGPINILIANAGITDESSSYPIWELPLSLWEKTYNTNIRGTFLTIKHFLLSAQAHQIATKSELKNLAIVITGSECGKFGQAGHAEYASGKAGLQYGLVRSVKNEIVRLNSKARINAVAPGWVDTPLIEGRLYDPKEMWTEAQATVPLRKIAKPGDVARAMAFLASERAAGHISGECLSIDGGMEGRIVWKEDEVLKSHLLGTIHPSITPSEALATPKDTLKIQILLSVDFDAVSGFLGTGASPGNNMSDYSSGFFAGQVGVPRLLKLFKKHQISSKVTWFIPGHSMETFPKEARMIVHSGAEIGCHGYAHEGAAQMTREQEEQVIEKCVELATKLTGCKPRGWRAPLYQLREHTVNLLEQHGFLYDTSLTHHDSQPYFLLQRPPIKPIDFSAHLPASSWMHPLAAPTPRTEASLVEIPCNWYMEDMTPMQFLPAAANSHGYVQASSILSMWQARFNYLYGEDDGENDFIFPLVLHPDTSGMAHIIGMIEEMIVWLKTRGQYGEVVFETFESVASAWKTQQDS